MRTFAVALTMGLTVISLGLRTADAADAIPFCLGIVGARDFFELFATPSGGTNVSLTGLDDATGGPVFGSGYVANGTFTFYFMTSANNSAGVVFRGALDLTTQTGTGRCFLVDATTNLCNSGDTLQYAVFPCE